MKWSGWLLVALMLVAPAAANALDPNRSIYQYKHTSWTRDDDAPAPVFSLAQDHRGFLWLGSRDGLYRFDGVHFEHITVQNDDNRYKIAYHVFVAKNDDVWVWFNRPGRFAVYRNGVLRPIPAVDLKEEPNNFAQAHDGAIWVGFYGSHILPLRYYNGRWETVGSSWGLRADDYASPFVSRDGSLWMSSTHGVWRLAPGTHHFERAAPGHKNYCMFVEDAEERVWCGDYKGVRLIAGPNTTTLSQNPSKLLAYPKGLTGTRFALDSNDNFWFGASLGINRVNLSSLARLNARSVPAPLIDSYGSHNGLSSHSISDLIVDREGDLWVGTTLGLDRFRGATIVVEPALTNSNERGDVLGVGSDGSVYIAEALQVYRVVPGGKPVPFSSSDANPRVLCEGRTGSIWFGGDHRLREVDHGRIHYYPLPTDEVYACAFDAQGRLWVTGAGPGLFRRSDSGWTTVVPPQPAINRRHAMIVDLEHRLVVLDPDRIRRLDGERSATLATLRDAPLDKMWTMLDTPTGLLLAGEEGLIRLQDRSVTQVSAVRVPLLANTTGLVQTGTDTWAIATAGAVRFRTRDLDRAFSDPSFIPPARAFSFSEGLPDGQANYRSKNMVRGGDGRLWIATWSGTAWLDPAQLGRDPPPPAVAITGVTAGSRSYRDPKVVKLPAGASALHIDFSVLTLKSPELARARYRLEGLERQWVDAGKRRVAYYTNLAPGRYRFRVIAANKDGPWDPAGASLDIALAPTFLQSRVFMAIILTLALVALWLLYRLRIRSLSSRMRARLHERVAERDRIARDLHDTLLQGFQGLVLRLQTIADKLETSSPLRSQMEDELDRADQVIVEGRNRVSSLRGDGPPATLPEVLAVIGEGLERDHPARFALRVEGVPRLLELAMIEEIGKVGSEALINAFRHAHAEQIEAVVSFGRKYFSVLVRDDGVGLDREMELKRRRPGHFGLRGMKERAQRCGGDLFIRRGQPRGTIVEVRVPARGAYSRARAQLWPGRLAEVRHRGGGARAPTTPAQPTTDNLS